MKKLIIILFTLLVAFGLFAQGSNEQVFNEFWTTLETEYPYFNEINLSEYKEENLEKVKKANSKEELMLILRGIANQYLAYDYIAISENPSADLSSIKAPRVDYIGQNKTVIFTISSLSPSVFTESFIEDSLDSVEGEIENIIFDFSNCKSGPTDDEIYSFIYPFGGTWEFSYRTYFRSLDKAKRYYNGYEITSINTLASVPEKVKKLKLEAYCDTKQKFDCNGGSLKKEIRDAKRWILIGENTLYEADLIAYFASQTGWATVVGTKTNGSGIGLAKIRKNLANSGIIMSYNTALTERKIFSGGTVPNVIAKDGKTAFATCLELIGNK